MGFCGGCFGFSVSPLGASWFRSFLVEVSGFFAPDEPDGGDVDSDFPSLLLSPEALLRPDAVGPDSLGPDSIGLGPERADSPAGDAWAGFASSPDTSAFDRAGVDSTPFLPERSLPLADPSGAAVAERCFFADAFPSDSDLAGWGACEALSSALASLDVLLGEDVFPPVL